MIVFVLSGRFELITDAGKVIAGVERGIAEGPMPVMGETDGHLPFGLVGARVSRPVQLVPVHKSRRVHIIGYFGEIAALGIYGHHDARVRSARWKENRKLFHRTIFADLCMQGLQLSPHRVQSSYRVYHGGPCRL